MKKVHKSEDGTHGEKYADAAVKDVYAGANSPTDTKHKNASMAVAPSASMVAMLPITMQSTRSIITSILRLSIAQSASVVVTFTQSMQCMVNMLSIVQIVRPASMVARLVQTCTHFPRLLRELSQRLTSLTSLNTINISEGV